jgi:peptide-methionine (S)-S-oxide reductase
MVKMPDNNLQTATFGLGCFWHSEEIFRKVRGVKETEVGFMGGITANPSYKQVSTGKTGHAEVVQLKYNQREVSYDKFLGLFWENHDPTERERQGPDIGAQYRSVIFYYTPEQEKIAKKSKEMLEKSNRFKKPIVTEITPAGSFYRAEEHHQRYLEKRNLAACPM